MNKARAVLHVNNERVLVTEWQFEPGDETGYHVHAMDYVVVPLTDGVLQVGGVTTPMRTGAAYARPAGVAHNVVNPGPHAFRFVEIELKSTSNPPTSPEGDPS
jgi:quercetin dioxygenase-like cupin family protein